MKQPVKRYLKVLLNLLLALAALFLCIFALPRLLLFFMPFLVGWLIAAIANPLVRFFEEKLRIKRKAGSAVVIVTVIALVILAGYLLISRLAAAGIGFVEMLPQLWNNMEADFKEIGQNLNVLYDGLPENIRDSITNLGQEMDGLVARTVSRLGTPTVNAVGNLAKNIPNMLINAIMCILSSYFFIAEKEAINSACQRCLPPQVYDKWRIVTKSLKDAVGGYFLAQLKIELWLYLLMLIGFLLLRIPFAPLIAFVIAVVDFLPFFGAGAIMLPWALLKFLSADYQLAVWLLVIWGAGQLLRQIIQPKIVGDSVGVAPLPTLILLFVGYKCAGVVGMILAVPLGIIIINMNQAGIFDRIKLSVRILVAGIARFCKYGGDDMEVLPENQRPQDTERELLETENADEKL
mgnify:FL=1